MRLSTYRPGSTARLPGRTKPARTWSVRAGTTRADASPSSSAPGPRDRRARPCAAARRGSVRRDARRGTGRRSPRRARRRRRARRARSAARRGPGRARRARPARRRSAGRWPPGGSPTLQRSIDGTARGRMRSGPSRDRSARAAVRSMPGPGSGDSSVGERKPALPRAAPEPSAAPSTTVTAAPRSCSASALVRPIRPPPTMMTDVDATGDGTPAGAPADRARRGHRRWNRWLPSRGRSAVTSHRPWPGPGSSTPLRSDPLPSS